MAKNKRFRVVREHEGDRFYNVGETREGSDHDLKHLVPHVLEPMEDEPAEKAETAPPANKAEGASETNKADDDPSSSKSARKQHK